jgi:cellulose synthase/poly-beta-1,6-N-acetylglucosamine synthase-like glycosyltransferase
MTYEKEESALGQLIEVLRERPKPQPEVPLVSVVMPTFNQGKFIERSILSVLNQDYPNIELIIVDGGSTDETAEIVARYADHIAVWLSEKDEGQSDALNKGFARATGVSTRSVSAGSGGVWGASKRDGGVWRLVEHR